MGLGYEIEGKKPGFTYADLKPGDFFKFLRDTNLSFKTDVGYCSLVSGLGFADPPDNFTDIRVLKFEQVKSAVFEEVAKDDRCR